MRTRYLDTIPPVPPRKVIKAVSTHFGVHVSQFTKTRVRTNELSFRRHALVYLLWHYTKLDQTRISKIVRRNRTSMPHAIRTINDMCISNPDIKNKLIEIEKTIEPDDKRR